MPMQYATITGRITVPNSDIGIRSKVTFTPQTTGNILTFSTDSGRVTIGAVVVETDKNGNLGADAKIPLGSDQGPVLWRIVVEPMERRGNLNPWALGIVPITASTTFAALTEGQVAVEVVTPTLVADVGALVVEAEQARNEAEAAAASVQRDQPNGVAPLDAEKQLPEANVPDRLSDASLKAEYVSVTEAPLNARRYGAKNDGVTDDSAAYQAAVNALPGNLDAGGGAIIIDGQTVWGSPVEIVDKAGVKFVSPGGFQSYISPGAGVAASGKPLIRVSSTASVVRGFQMENVNIDMIGVAAHAIEIAGGFDNTELCNVWVRGVHRDRSAFRFVPGGNDGISQSIILDSVQGIRTEATSGAGPACTAPMFLLDRVHETILRLTKAISTGQAVGGVGYEIRDCEQVTLDLPSASNLQDSFKITTTGGALSSQAITIRDPYLETVQRGVVAIGASEAAPVLKVRLLHPRVSNPAGSPMTSVFDGTYARLCELDIYDEPVVLGAGAYMNQIACVVDNVTDNSGSGLNAVRTAPNGLGNGLDENGFMRLDGRGAALGVDQTGMLVKFSPYGGTPVWRRVKMGAENSGGTGFRTLIVPN